VTTMGSMFDHCKNLKSLDLSKFNTAKVTDMSNMFNFCSSLSSLDISSFNTSNVNYMSNMFSYCTGLSNLDISNFDTSKVINMSGMFYACSNLKDLDISNFDTSKVTNMSNMFDSCGLSNLNVSNFDTSNVVYMSGMFNNCKSLTNLDVSNWDISKVADMSCMFDGCSGLVNLDVSNFDTSKDDDITYERELEIRIKEYIDALNPWSSVATNIPEFSNINDADKYWIGYCMRMYFKKNYDTNMYYGSDYEQYFQKESEKIKDILFGEEFTNYEYIEPEITGNAYDMQRTYITSVEKIGELYKVTTIPYKVFDSGWEEVRELNDITIYDLTETKVCTLTYIDKGNNGFKQVENKIEQYLKENEQKFAKQILEIKLDNETGNLHIVSSKIVSR